MLWAHDYSGRSKDTAKTAPKTTSHAYHLPVKIDTKALCNDIHSPLLSWKLASKDHSALQLFWDGLTGMKIYMYFAIFTNGFCIFILVHLSLSFYGYLWLASRWWGANRSTWGETPACHKSMATSLHALRQGWQSARGQWHHPSPLSC